MSNEIWGGFTSVLFDVALALIPLLLFFCIFQLFFLKLKTRKVIDTLVGFALTYLGLSLFLQGVNIGFLPVGEMMGEQMGQLEQTWLLVPIGFVLGFFAAYAEPAVTVLIHQVDKVSGGYIPKQLLLYTISIGVGLSIALSMVKVLVGFSIWYYVLPGYLLVFILTRGSSKLFTAIAFDSGGIVTGPMIATFMLAMFVGIASVTEGRDPLIDGFGMIALVALAPILSVLILGKLFQQTGGR
ncbi:DUF1538 domain-containing protein [Amphibacillus cookii]|uniref:DUF1538 domain-containing protein n=1 Tax=Amphibacillus cookii TaxID=767787 RepID=UPI00195D60F1|nr:DUF1538 domain-containing protein [Amphibacillus cookii]MBM7539939.1 multisubunit Na+/H+ antiporter MnhC subunit [Amphibacillus cookii]